MSQSCVSCLRRALPLLEVDEDRATIMMIATAAPAPMPAPSI